MPGSVLKSHVGAAPAAGIGPAEEAVSALRAHTLVGICQAEIERMILEAELGMGARVNELALAARLGISRGPVREACRSLVQAGLLETQFNRGFFVRRLTLREVGDLYDLRAGLMRLAGELLAERATKAQLTGLRKLVAGMDDALARSDTARFRALNADFHAALIDAADNRRLQDVYQGLAKEIRLFRRRGLDSVAAMTQSNREHHLIVAAAGRRDRAATADAMYQHILQGKARFLAAAGTEIE